MRVRVRVRVRMNLGVRALECEQWRPPAREGGARVVELVHHALVALGEGGHQRSLPRGLALDVTVRAREQQRAHLLGRCREMWGDAGRCGEMWGDMGTISPASSSARTAPPRPAAAPCMSAVRPISSRSSMRACASARPFFRLLVAVSSRLTAPQCPAAAASMRAVLPSGPRALALAPLVGSMSMAASARARAEGEGEGWGWGWGSG